MWRDKESFLVRAEESPFSLNVLLAIIMKCGAPCAVLDTDDGR